MAEIVITSEMELPEILSRYPVCRKVLAAMDLLAAAAPSVRKKHSASSPERIA
jgi:hypothetical protein